MHDSIEIGVRHEDTVEEAGTGEGRLLHPTHHPTRTGGTLSEEVALGREQGGMAGRGSRRLDQQ